MMGMTYFKTYLGFLFIAFFGFLLPLFLMDSTIKLEMLLFYFLTFYSTLRLGLIIKSGRIRMLEMTFFIFVYIFFGVAALAQIKAHRFPWGGIYTTDSVTVGGLVILSGILAYEAGLIFNKTRQKKAISLPKNFKVNLPVVTIVGVAFFLLGVAGKGGPQALFLPRNELTAVAQSLGVDSTTGLILTVFLRIPILVALFFALLTYLDKTNKNIMLKSNFPLVLLIVFLGITTIVANNPVSTARYWVGTIYISLLFTALKWNRLTQPILLVAITLLLLVIFPYADIFRNSIDAELNIRPLVGIMEGKGDYDSFQQVMNIVNYTSQYGITYGMQLLGVLLFWVPRSIWPDKPIGTGATVAEGIGYGFTNVSAPLWSEFYINFGFIGMLIMFFLYGWMSGNLQIKYEISRINKLINFYRIFVPVFAAYQLFMLRGDLLSSFAYVAPIFIFIFLGFRYEGVKRLVLKKDFRLAKAKSQENTVR